MMMMANLSGAISRFLMSLRRFRAERESGGRDADTDSEKLGLV